MVDLCRARVRIHENNHRFNLHSGWVAISYWTGFRAAGTGLEVRFTGVKGLSTTRVGAVSSAGRGRLLDRGERALLEILGAADVDILHLGGGLVRVVMDQDADAALEAAGHGHLVSAEEGHLRPAEPARRQRRELRV